MLQTGVCLGSIMRVRYFGATTWIDRFVMAIFSTCFVMATSASLFNSIVYSAMNSNIKLASILGPFLTRLSERPTTLLRTSPRTFADAVQAGLDSVDGGEDNENVPASSH